MPNPILLFRRRMHGAERRTMGNNVLLYFNLSIQPFLIAHAWHNIIQFYQTSVIFLPLGRGHIVQPFASDFGRQILIFKWTSIYNL